MFLVSTFFSGNLLKCFFGKLWQYFLYELLTTHLRTCSCRSSQKNADGVENCAWKCMGFLILAFCFPPSTWKPAQLAQKQTHYIEGIPSPFCSEFMLNGLTFSDQDFYTDDKLGSVSSNYLGHLSKSFSKFLGISWTLTYFKWAVIKLLFSFLDM